MIGYKMSQVLDGRYFMHTLEHSPIEVVEAKVKITKNNIEHNLHHLPEECVCRVILEAENRGRHANLLICNKNGVKRFEPLHGFLGDADHEFNMLIKKNVNRVLHIESQHPQREDEHGCNAYVLMHAYNHIFGDNSYNDVNHFSASVKKNVKLPPGEPDIEYGFGKVFVGALGGGLVGGLIAGPVGLGIGALGGGALGAAASNREEYYVEGW
jgi:hypothetical protein